VLFIQELTKAACLERIVLMLWNILVCGEVIIAMTWRNSKQHTLSVLRCSLGMTVDIV